MSRVLETIRRSVALLLAGVLSIGAGAQSAVSGGLTEVNGAATPGDEVVLGVDGEQMVLLVHPGKAPKDWFGAETRIATWDGAPWKVVRPAVWGRVPQHHAAWADAGTLIHLDIDPGHGMAVLSTVRQGRLYVSLSTRITGDAWSVPWPVPALVGFNGDAAFAVFDTQEGREGDLLVALRPEMKGNASLPTPDAGHWKGGYDMARIARKGGYTHWALLDALNAAGNDMALVPGPGQGGWFSAQRLGGAGGLDPWWCPQIPVGAEMPEALGGGRLTGHTLEVTCRGERIKGLAWQVSLESGFPVGRFKPGTDGLTDLGALVAGERYRFDLLGRPPEFCAQPVAEWRDGAGQLMRRFSLGGANWSLSFLSTLALPGWQLPERDRSRLPEVASEARSGPAADWVVFHGLGSVSITMQDRDQLRAMAKRMVLHPEDVIQIVGHASHDGQTEANALLAEERARHVAAHLEFAGLSSSQIRFEGKGDLIPLEQCPPGVSCPQDMLARSRRTELYIRIGTRSDGGGMQ